MTIWAVITFHAVDHGSYDSMSVHAVCSTREKAEQLTKQYGIKEPQFEEWTVDELI